MQLQPLPGVAARLGSAYIASDKHFCVFICLMGEL